MPATIAALASLPMLLPLERTAGDELQGALDDGDTLSTLLRHLLRAGSWQVGVGIGELDEPLPESTRAGRGPAFVAARVAVESAKSAWWHLRVDDVDGGHGRDLETAAWLWATLLSRRTARGWEVADLLEDGLTHQQAADRLDITRPAVSQRARAARVVEGLRARTGVEPGGTGAGARDPVSGDVLAWVALALRAGSPASALAAWLASWARLATSVSLGLLLLAGAVAGLPESVGLASHTASASAVAVCAVLAVARRGPATVLVFGLVDRASPPSTPLDNVAPRDSSSGAGRGSAVSRGRRSREPGERHARGSPRCWP